MMGVCSVLYLVGFVISLTYIYTDYPHYFLLNKFLRSKCGRELVLLNRLQKYRKYDNGSILPWQIKSTFIIYTKLLKIRYFPVFSSIFRFLLFYPNLAYLGICWHIFPCKSGKKSGKLFAFTTRLFQAPATLRISSFASSKFTWVYVFKVTLISECPMIYCRVLGFMPDFAMLEQKV